MSKTYADLNRTKFPDEIDSFVLFKDPDANTNSLLIQYQLYLANGRYSEAAQYLTQHPELGQYIVSADRLNQLLHAITAIEKLYTTDIQDMIQSLPESFERRGPIRSETKPVGQVAGEFWFKDTKGAHTIHEKQENGIYAQLYLDAAGIKNSNGETLDKQFALANHTHLASDIIGDTGVSAVYYMSNTPRYDKDSIKLFWIDTSNGHKLVHIYDASTQTWTPVNTAWA